MYDAIRFDRSWSLCVPAFLGVKYTSEQEKQIIKDYDESLNQISDKYGMKDWIKISHTCGLSFSDWLNLSVYAKNALVHDFNEYVEDLNKQKERDRKEKELEARQAAQRDKIHKQAGADSSRLSIFG